DGLCALTADDFQKAGIDLGSVDPSRIAIYGGSGADLIERTSHIDSNVMAQVPAIVERGGDGRASRVLFYGAGPSVWEYRGSDTIPTHRISPFVSSNSYIVAVDGDATRGFDTRTSPNSFDVTPSFGIGRLFFDEDKVNAIDID